MKLFILFFFFLSFGFTYGQTVIDFEEFGLELDTFLTDAGEAGGLQSGDVFMPNFFDPFFWTGWSISTMTDTTTPGFTNDRSAITGGGHDGSRHYVAGYAFDPSSIVLQGSSTGRIVEGMYLTNSTFAYLSMRDGDAFSKRFGGVSGEDPDFFLLTIRGFLDGEETSDSVEFYLADYRFEDNSLDYILDDWTWVDLSVFGGVDSLTFLLSSSDVGMFGMNTPAYFCMDDLTLGDFITSADQTSLDDSFRVYPNPASDFIQLESASEFDRVSLLDLSGQTVRVYPFRENAGTLNVSDINPGSYLLSLESGGQRQTTRIVIR